MNTPIADFVKKYAESHTIRAHMPGHKGISPYSAEYPFSESCKYDITEIKGADSLFEADGIIAESEKNASRIFGSSKTLYSTGGSTLCIQTMLALALKREGKKRPAVIAARNCHRAFINACIFLDAEIIWLFPEYENGSIVSGIITPEAVKHAFAEAEEKGLAVSCVYMTSPDYLGRLTSLDEIAEETHSHGAKLLVDNAHGAYLRFVKDDCGIPLHPLYHGADLCCDSAHKTLPVLTGGAYLHLGRNFHEEYEGQAKEIMSMFGSTSPSYLILQSLDLCNRYMSERISEDLAAMKKAMAAAKEMLSPFRYIENTEPAKLTIYSLPSGLTGRELADRMRERGIECEYSDFTHAVLMFSPMSGEKDIISAAERIMTIPQPRILIPPPDVNLIRPKKIMTVREAAFSPSETIPAEKAVGRICARAYSCCPPGIAVIVGGEVFDESSVKILKNYSIFNVNVVK